MIDPSHLEEAVMGGRMTTTLKANGDVCAIQKAGGEGVCKVLICSACELLLLKPVTLWRR